MSFDIHIPTPEKRVLSWDGPGPEMGVAGYYRLILRNRDGSVARDTGWFKNLITNNGMKRMVNYATTPPNWGAWLAIGDGTGTPAFTDTALSGAQLGNRKVATTSVSGYTASYYYRRYLHRWPTGEGTGTIAELGYWTDTIGGTLFSRALLVDGGGSPTTIVKGADQSLDVYYELRVYPKLTDTTGTIDISGVSYDYALRPWAFYDHVGAWWTVNATEKIAFSGTYHYAYTNQGLIATNSSTITGSNLGFGVSVSPVTYSYYSGPLPDYNTGPYYSDNYIEANIDDWVGEIDWVRTRGGQGGWQMTLTKTVGGGGLVKTDEERLRLHIRLTMARH